MFTAIVEMFVLKAEKVPYESSEDFERRKNWRQQVSVNVQRLREWQRDGPAKPWEREHEFVLSFNMTDADLD